MTAFDRIEPRMPDLLAELAPARMPDYVESLLEQSAHTRQRPAWASLERWIPMDIASRAAPVRAVPWRLIAVLAVIGLLLVALAVAAIGSRPAELPAPFGPARNGQIVVGTTDGSIAVLDPTTLALTPLVDGDTDDGRPTFLHQGDRLAFVRRTLAGEELWVADADGSDRRLAIPAGPRLDWIDWTPDFSLAVRTKMEGGLSTAVVVDLASGTETPLGPGQEVVAPTWRPGHDQIVFFTPDRGYYLVGADGSGLRPIPAADGSSDQFSLSPDGRLMAYMTWQDPLALQGQIHVIDIDGGDDRIVTPEGEDGFAYIAPAFSPDGRRILADRHDVTDRYQVVVLDAGGQGPGVAIGPAYPSMTGGSNARWSPDGTQILADYDDDLAAWLLDAAGGPGRRLGFGFDGLTWQRLAP